MLGYDVEIFEANGEKTISTSYPNIYILLRGTGAGRVCGEECCWQDEAGGADWAGFARQCWLGADGMGRKSSGSNRQMECWARKRAHVEVTDLHSIQRGKSSRLRSC
jgi:hypothetical protein